MSEGKPSDSGAPKVSDERLRTFVNALFAADDAFAEVLSKLYDQFEDCVPQQFKDALLVEVSEGASPYLVAKIKASIMFNAIEFYSKGEGIGSSTSPHSRADDPN